MHIKIPEKAIEKIIEWNDTKREDWLYDKKICQSLLLSLVSNENLRESFVADEVMEFIRGNVFMSYFPGIILKQFFFIVACFVVRCETQQDRIDAIHSYKKELCDAIKKNPMK